MSGRRGLSLLEVVLAIAILGGALVVIGQLIRLGSRSATAARELTQAQLYCESLLAEIAAGAQLPQSVAAAALEPEAPDSPWRYSVAVEGIENQGLVSVRVTVEQDPQLVSQPVSFSLVRWMVDPGVEASQTEAAEEQLQSGSSAPSMQSATPSAAGASNASSSGSGGSP